MSAWETVGLNVFSNYLFVLSIAFFLGLLLLSKRGRLGKAQQFFGLRKERNVKIYVPGFVHPGMSTKRVVNALEYEAAVEVKRGIEKLSEYGLISWLIHFLAGLISRKVDFPTPDIEAGPLDVVKEPPYSGSLILIGGPVTNQLSKFYLQEGSPQFRFNEKTQLYQERVNNEYTDIVPSGNTAIIEKRIIEGQIIFLAHGFGEEQTKRAALYLINHWETLYQAYSKNEFGIRV